MNILLLIDDSAKRTGTVVDHISSFENFSRHNIVVFDSYLAGQLKLNLELFDAVVFHYSIVISRQGSLPAEFVERLAEYRNPKILFIQDEYRWVDRTAAAIEKLGILVVFTVVNKDVIRKIYRHPYFEKVRFEQTLTGFVPEHLVDRAVPSFRDRHLDIIYRARKLPAWCGYFAQQKWKIGIQVKRDAQKLGLETDIAMSEESRIYGEAWIDFVAGAKATLGTGSGSSFVDFTGEVMPAVDEFEAEFPDAEFEDVKDRFLEGRDGDIVIDVISPRVFEAVALRTLLIMYPGNYSGVVQPGRHYLVLEKDHSNMADVVEVLRDPGRAEEIIDRAFREVACDKKWTFRGFMEHFDRVVEEEIGVQSLATAEPEIIDTEIARMQRSYRRAYRWNGFTQKIKTALVKIIQSGMDLTSKIVQSVLPERFARPVLAAGIRVVAFAKPLLRRIILGRSGIR